MPQSKVAIEILLLEARVKYLAGQRQRLKIRVCSIRCGADMFDKRAILGRAKGPSATFKPKARLGVGGPAGQVDGAPGDYLSSKPAGLKAAATK